MPSFFWVLGVYFLFLYLQRVMCDLPECACLLSDTGLTWVDPCVHRIWVWTLTENIKKWETKWLAMVQFVKYLPHRQEAPCSILRIQVESQAWWWPVTIPLLRGQRQEDLGPCSLDWAAGNPSSSERSYFP